MNRQEKSLRHVAMVARFLDDSKPKKSLKSLLALFQLHQSYSISFNLANRGATTAKKFTKQRDARAKLLSCCLLIQTSYFFAVPLAVAVVVGFVVIQK